MLLLISALCVVLAVFCSQEGMRPPLADQSFSFIHRFLYEHNIFDEVFISMMIITILMFRGFQQLPLFRVLFIGMAIYFGGRLYLSEYMSLASSPFSYHAIMQSGLVLVTAYVTVLVARRCAAFDELVKSLFVPGSARVALDFEAANDKAHHILQYCRRNGHPAGVIVLKPDLSAGQAVFPEVVKRYLAEAARSAVSLKVASRVAHGLRRTDILVPGGEGGEIAVVCPEADSHKLQAMLRRITDDVSASLGIALRTGSAQFPKDAFTFDDLLRVANSQMDQEANASSPTGAEGYGSASS